MGIKVTNNAYGVLAAGITASDTTLSVGAGEGARFPSLAGGDYFYLTLVDTANNIEIVKVTARSTDTMTIVRAQDGTTAKIYPINSRAELRPCAAMFAALLAETNDVSGATGILPKASLPTGSVLQVVTASVGSQVSNSTTTYADTNLTATITPTSSTSKILVLIDQGIFALGGAAVGYGFQTNMGVKLVRNSTDLVTPASDSGGKYTLALSTGAAPASGTIGVWGSCNIIYLDSPATTSATTYKTQFAKGTSGMSIAYVNGSTGASTITLLEIAA